MSEENKYKTDKPCKCGSNEFKEASSGFVGYMGSRPVYESEYKCIGCGNRMFDGEFSKLWEATND